MASIRKIFSEKGLVLGIEFREASEVKEFRDSRGELVKVPAKLNRYVVKVVSSSSIDGDKGMVTPSYAELEITENNILYLDIRNGKLKYLDDINVDLEMTTSGIKMLGISKIDKK